MAVSDTIGTVGRRTPWHLWVVGGLSLLWNAVGAFDYLATQLQLEAYMSQYTPEQLEYFYGVPTWMVAAWALGVWGAFAGSILLLLRRRWAVWAFAVSILGMAVTTAYSYLLSDGAEIMGVAGVVFSVVIWVIAILLLLYAIRQARAGVLR